jgi:hypothetical protein
MDKKLKRYYRKQRLLGLMTVILSILSIFIDMDGTWAILGVPLGLWLTFTKKRVLTDPEIETDFD